MSGYPSQGGLPHSDTHGSTPARGSPWLFAACHVLHRLLVPRHPPNALLILNLSASQMRTPKGCTRRPSCTDTIPRGTNPSKERPCHHSAQISRIHPAHHPRPGIHTPHPQQPAIGSVTHTHTPLNPRSPTHGAPPSQAALPVRHRAKPRSTTQHTARSCHTRPETPLKPDLP